MSFKPFSRILLAVSLAGAACVAVPAQSTVSRVYAAHRPDYAVGGFGQFTRDVSNTNVNDLYTANSAGVLATVREHLYGADLEVNYGYTRYRERFLFNNAKQTVDVKPGVHEATAGLLFHPRLFGFSPFMGGGGGYTDFRGFQEPNHQGPNQFRGTGYGVVGFDLPVKSSQGHMGFRMQGRSVFYRSPNYYQPRIADSAWVVSIEPSMQVWVKF